MKNKKIDISIVVPVYNEENSIHPLYLDIKNNINSEMYNWELIFINDGSNDKSDDYIKDFISSQKTKENDTRYVYINYPKNQGKGFALKKGVLVSTNDNSKYMGAILSEMMDIQPKVSHSIEHLCSSGTSAIISAYSYISSGLLDIVLISGVESPSSFQAERVSGI